MVEVHINNVSENTLFLWDKNYRTDYSKSIKDCLEEDKFNKNTAMIRITCRSTEIPRLGRASIRELKALYSINIFDCPIKTIEPRAFIKVPELEWIRIENAAFTEIRKDVFNNIKKLTSLYLINNTIEYIEDYAFGNMENLRVVSLAHNGLKYVTENWFLNSNKIISLDISYNFITMIRSKTFRHLPNLLNLFMSHNTISVIDLGAFEGLTRLDQLRLDSNRISIISPEIFPKNFEIYRLDLRRNLLNYISNRFLDRILKYGNLNILGNPIKCSCFERINKWIYQKNYNASKLNWKYSDDNNCPADLVPVCVADFSSDVCTETSDIELTKKYEGTLNEKIVMYCFTDNTNVLL